MVNREKQIRDAEELLGHGQTLGFAHGLFFGRYLDKALLPYPNLTADASVNQAVEDVRKFCQEQIDPVKIDRDADIPRSVIDGLGKLGVLGWAVPKEGGGQGRNQQSYCRVLELIGARCAGTAVFVNAHHSIGVRALVLFGTEAQQKKWLPKLVTGEHLGAFALTEPEAGSDAANVQTTAKPTPDGKGFLLNGQKRYITNASIAQVLTVMARTPAENGKDSKISAFLVTPEMPGFEILEARMDKLGIRGTATSRLKFTDMFVPKENILGPQGKGLKVALTVLDFGRTTFGASCTGAAKFCVEKAVEHAKTRVQFGETLGSFELVKQKLAHMASGAYAMEAATYQTAALIDSGTDDYMLETAMLKVFATDVLWQIINDTIQIYGGKAYFTDEPFERMLRDARINTIGEGANDVLRAMLISMVGLRNVGLELKGVLDALSMPIFHFGKLRRFASRRLGQTLFSPEPRVHSDAIIEDASQLGRTVGLFGTHVERFLGQVGGNPLKLKDVNVNALAMKAMQQQYQLARIADCATELYVSACVLSRLDHTLSQPQFDKPERHRQLQLGLHYLRTADRRIRSRLSEMFDNDDSLTTATANLLLGK